MSDDPNNQRLDDEIADFTDRLLSQSPDSAVQGDPQKGAEELVRLQQTVLQLKQAAPNQSPPPSLVARLRLAILSEYRRMQNSTEQVNRAQPGAHSFWKKLVDGFRQQPRRLSMGLTVVTVAALAITLLFFPSDQSLPATAGLTGYRFWGVLGLGAVCVAIVVWLLREKK
jgi:hypothetical protein